MVELYIRLIQDGLKTLENVPERYRDAVRAALDKAHV